MFAEYREVYICTLKKSSMINCSDNGTSKTGKSLLSGRCTTEGGKLIFKRQSNVGLDRKSVV